MSLTTDRNEQRTRSIVEASRLIALLDRTIDAVIAAWRESSVVRAARRLPADGGGPGGRWQFVLGVTMIASATALVLQRLASRPAPLIWIVPALSLVAGACVFALARVRARRQP